MIILFGSDFQIRLSKEKTTSRLIKWTLEDMSYDVSLLGVVQEF